MKNDFSIKILIVLIIAIFSILPSYSAHVDFGNGFISDDANLVYNKELLNGILLNLHNETKADMVVVTLNSRGQQTFQDIEHEIINNYHIGGDRKENWAMLIVTKTPYRMKIRVGSGLKHAIPASMKRAMAGEFWLHKQFNPSDRNMAQNTYTMTLLLAEAIADEYNTRLYSNVMRRTYNGVSMGYVQTQTTQALRGTNSLDKFLRRNNLFITFYIILFGIIVPLIIKYGGRSSY